MSSFLLEVYKKGGKIGAYKSAAKDSGLIIKSEFDFTDELPWDVIQGYPPKSQLINEYNRLLKRLHNCNEL